MNLSEISIRRPVLATVVNLLIVVVGLAAWRYLPIREYPDIDVPVVSISTTWFGASPQTIESSVTEPIEQGLNGIEGIRSISSVSAFSVSQVTVEFESGRDLDVAANDVSNAVQRVLGELPQEAEKPTVSKAGGGGSEAIMWSGLYGDGWSAVDRTDIADRMIKTPVQLIPGVARVMLSGERRYAMRVWLDPARMAARGVEPGDVRRALRENNLQVPAGSIEGTGRKFTVNVDARLADPELYERLVIRREGENIVRIADVGRVEMGSSNYENITRAGGRPSVGVGIVPMSTANQLDVSRRIREAFALIIPRLPEGLDLRIAVDRSLFVRESLKQAATTLVFVFALVIAVNLLFLRSPISTIIASLAIPISLVGALAAMAVFGFSINVLTVLGLILAIGMLVDDSIVVLENIYRRQELGEAPERAARNGAREVAFPVIATTAAVVAVLVPLAAIAGNTGRLFREFAITMTAAVCLSTLVALTAVPMACALFLRVPQKHGRLWELIENTLESSRRGYERGLSFALGHRALMGVFLVAVLGATAFMFRQVPTTLAPLEDRGQVITMVRAPQGSTAAYTDRALRQIEEHLLATPEVDTVFAAVALGFGGPADTAGGIVFTRLHDWSERRRSQQEVVSELFPKFMAIPEALVFPINPPSLGGSGRNSDLQLIIKGSDASLADLERLAGTLMGQLRQTAGLVNVDTDVRLDNPQLDVTIDREKAADLGVSVASVADSLRLLIAEGPADDFVLRNKQYDVIMAVARGFSSVPEQLEEIHVRTATGDMVPISALVTVRPTVGPATLNHYDLERSMSVTANLAPGASMGDVMPQVLRATNEILPAGFSVALGGVSREFVESGQAIYVTFALALLIIFLVLAAQFESFLHPFTVMLSVPLACLGALVTLFALGHTLNVFSGIGIILLVGLVTKNSILLVDFANQERARGADLLAAVRAAGRTRFRPILMTSFTSILGAIPLAVAVGAGAESRRAIGAAVVGGLLFSSVFTLLVVPALHVLVVSAGERLGLRTVPPLIELDEIVPST